MNPALYSALYNAYYLVPEFIISSIVVFLLQKRNVFQIYL
jgi:thiamine transporter ThiT